MATILGEVCSRFLPDHLPPIGEGEDRRRLPLGALPLPLPASHQPAALIDDRRDGWNRAGGHFLEDSPHVINLLWCQRTEGRDSWETLSCPDPGSERKARKAGAKR